MNIDHISVSRKSIWDECHEKYKFQYHLKTPPQGPEPIYFAYGKMIHYIAETYVERGDPDAFTEIVSDVVSGKVEIDPGQTAPKLDKEYSNKLVKHCKALKNIIDRFGLGHEGQVEYKFRYDLMPPKGYHVTGFIDRIIKKGDKYFICDYKTTKRGPWLKNEHTILSDLQLRVYARVVQKEFGVDPENIHCCLVYLDSGDVIGATFNQKSLDDAEKELLEAYIQIHNMDPNEVYGRVGEHCRRCDFRKLCRFYSLT